MAGQNVADYGHPLDQGFQPGSHGVSPIRSTEDARIEKFPSFNSVAGGYQNHQPAQRESSHRIRRLVIAIGSNQTTLKSPCQHRALVYRLVGKIDAMNQFEDAHGHCSMVPAPSKNSAERAARQR
jgi:hypothetical protein